MELSALLDAQRTYFRTGSTRSLAFRELMLDTLYREIRKMEPEINAALQADLGKSGFETYMCETGLTLSEISFMKSHLRDFAAKKRVKLLHSGSSQGSNTVLSRNTSGLYSR